MITFDSISKHEMIGLETEITTSSNNQLVGLTGTIIDETKSMFTLRTKHGSKMIPKIQNTWKFFFEDNEFTFSGNLLEKRSFDRLGAKI